jgi:hypothetical protein
MESVISEVPLHTSTKRAVIYADASVVGDVSVVAWYIDKKHFGAVRIAPQVSFHTEAQAMLVALSHSTSTTTLVSDHSGLITVLRKARTGREHPDPLVVSVWEALKERGALIRQKPGHGQGCPQELKFCDVLSRAAARSAVELDLQVGDELIASESPCLHRNGATPVWSSKLRALPPVPDDPAIGLFQHVQTNVRIAIGLEPHQYKGPWGKKHTGGRELSSTMNTIKHS